MQPFTERAKDGKIGSMIEQQLAQTDGDWQDQIDYLQEALAKHSSILVDAEAELAEKLQAIYAFEYQFRHHSSHLVRRLEQLTDEINALRKQLRRADDDDGPVFAANFWETAAAGATAGAAYRYREPPVQAPPPEISNDQGAQLKKLYRDLARRFHPDMALDEADRAYRTQIMMAINAAHAAGDLEKLQKLALEPDSVDRIDYARTSKQLAEALLRELHRVKERVREITVELDRLEDHQNTRLMRRARQMAAAGQDFFAEIARDLNERIHEKMGERDYLKNRLAELKQHKTTFVSEAFADVVWNATLDNMDDDPDLDVNDWTSRRIRHDFDDDDFWDDHD